MSAEVAILQKPMDIPYQVVGIVAAWVASGKMRPGEQLPSEKELSELLGVGRSSIREALRAMELLGLVETLQGKGSFIKENTERFLFLSSAVRDESLLSIVPVIQMIEARKVIEVAISRMAAERATSSQIARMRSLAWQMEEHKEDRSMFVDTHVAFHMLVAESSGNMVLTQMVGVLSPLLRVGLLAVAEADPAMCEGAGERHQAIADAIAARDPELAASITAKHLDALREAYERFGR